MSEKQKLTAEHRNSYDWSDTIKREAVMMAGPLKMACFRVRDPDTGEYGARQFHATFDNTVMAVMSEESAKLFARFVTGVQAPKSEDAA